MKREIINPPALFESTRHGFSQAAIHGGDRKIVYIAGQVAFSPDQQVIGKDDLVVQAREAFKNLRRMLAEVGAEPGDVVRLRTYVVNHSLEKLAPVTAAILEFYEGAIPAPNTFIGVQSLALPDFLIEVEATAVI
ncbi:enamine deaminase RidA [Xaviernesmea oryzae]|uniref:Enamine deaminase RidA n=1 Tax=Xaviernesmea oryzae TaxID=464029 RepID=A0A1Q9AU40_9HYPH|nr:RidA family protein [Xaviernesmea oryzae]OLP58911.1 enamine deaminase RidA [Xaviernesmea oryzae]SEM02127.1 Enamine deaminase RidA, house cleaning of reactive enamine intermediates, YjgF/YER057c/UK114 family [Xaviernesmea oryzae]